jgi:outer membrane protein TolC
MRRKSFLLLVVALLVRPELSRADTTMTLKEVLNMSLTNSASLAIGKEKILEKDSQKLERLAAFIPRLSVNLFERDATTNLKAQGISFPGFPSKVGPFSTFDGRLSFNEMLLNYSQWKQVHAADEETGAARLDLSQTESDLLYQTTLLFLNTKKAESSLLADQANVNLSDELLKFAEHQKENGVATLIEVTRASVKLAEDKQRLVTETTRKNDAYLSLQKQIGAAQGEPLLLDDRYLTSFDLPDLQESIKIALSRRKDLAAQNQREKIREIQENAAHDEQLPSLNVFADYGESGNDLGDSFPTQTIGISLTWPIYDGNLRKSHIGTAQSARREEQFRSKDLTQQVELDVRQVFNDIVSVKKELELAEERLALAEKELKLAQDRFESGVGTHIELVRSQTSLTEARETEIEARFELQAGLLRYFYVSGQMDEFLNRLP